MNSQTSPFLFLVASAILNDVRPTIYCSHISPFMALCLDNAAIGTDIYTWNTFYIIFPEMRI